MTPLTARLTGIVHSPRATMAGLAATTRPPWVDVLAVSTLVTWLALSVLLSTKVGQTALVDQWERTSLAFGQVVDDPAYARMQALSGRGIAYAAGLALLTGPLLTVGAATSLLIALRLSGQNDVQFRTLASVAAHAGIILAMRHVIASPINYLSETLASPTSLGVMVAGLSEGSPVARFLGVIDVFVLWWAIVLAMGVAAVAHRRTRPLAITFTGVYVAIALILALAMAATGGSA